MLIGVPKEIKNNEFRAGLTPASVTHLVQQGHKIIVESQLGAGISIEDQEYIDAGAGVVSTASEIFDKAELVVKVKEPQPDECRQLREGQTLFTYLHLAPDLLQTQLLLESKVTAIAYETVTDPNGRLPLLAPMSEVAGRLSIQAGAHCLEKAQGGHGKLLGGVPGVAPANVIVIGGGSVGEHAATMAVGAGANVTLFDASLPRLRELDRLYKGSVTCLFANTLDLKNAVIGADLVIGAVLLPGASAPKLVSAETVSKMQKGSVLLDVAIDQGGCFETSKATTHQHPTYIVDGVVHYCVANMPGAVPHTSTVALNHAIVPYIDQLASKGFAALHQDKGFMNGLNCHRGQLTIQAVGDAHGFDVADPYAILPK